MPVFRTILVISFSFALIACNDEPAEAGPNLDKKPAAGNEAIKKQFMQANKQLMLRENDIMDAYARSHGLSFVKTSSGIRYYVLKPSEKGDSIREGTRITIDYVLKLMDGTVCYTSAEDGRRTFTVGQDEIESGLHKGVQYLKTGDKAILLIPSPLAHGLLGDMKKIPPQMPIVYEIQIY